MVAVKAGLCQTAKVDLAVQITGQIQITILYSESEACNILKVVSSNARGSRVHEGGSQPQGRVATAPGRTVEAALGVEERKKLWR